jgi:seryl-tRNA synthetase
VSEAQDILNSHDLDALAAGLRQLGWRENLARARVEIVRERIAERGIKSVADLEEARHRLLEENAALAARVEQVEAEREQLRRIVEEARKTHIGDTGHICAENETSPLCAAFNAYDKARAALTPEEAPPAPSRGRKP